MSEVLNQLASYTSRTYYVAQCLVVRRYRPLLDGHYCRMLVVVALQLRYRHKEVRVGHFGRARLHADLAAEAPAPTLKW